MMSVAPEKGAVLGVDIGYSQSRATGAVCCLLWNAGEVTWRIARFRYDQIARRTAIRAVAGDAEILAAAFDGPFRKQLDVINVYRAVERILTRQVARHIGKPGPAHVPNGRKLNDATNAAVNDVLHLARPTAAQHDGAVHEATVVEAFPNTFLGVMLSNDHGLAKGRGGKSDRYYVALASNGALLALTNELLPGRTPDASFGSVKNHDDRAALVCALSALCVVADRYVAVGDDNGRIILPPAGFWNDNVLRLVRENCFGENDAALIAQPSG